LENAFNILCKQRKDYSAHADIWELRYNWSSYKQQIITQIQAGIFYFEPVTQYMVKNEICYKRTARDALILKAISLVLNDYLAPKLGKVYHLKGHGGISGAIRHVKESLAKNKFVFKTDIKSYYQSINHNMLIKEIDKLIPDKQVVNLIENSVRRTNVYGEVYWDCKKGIMQGSSLSPLLGAVALLCWDKAMQKHGFTYARYMDDLVVLTPTRTRLRKAIKVIYQALKPWGYQLHTNEKTYIGKIAKGFDFCGFRLSYNKIILAKSCLAKFEKRLSKLYEQLSKCKSSSYKNTFTTTALLKKIELYVWRFELWAWVVRRSVIKNCGVIAHSYYIKQTISANPLLHN
jgi:retron-type reverse transcriptase